MLKKLARYIFSKKSVLTNLINFLTKGTKEGYQYVLQKIATYPFFSESIQSVG